MTVDISSSSNRRIIDTARLKTRRRRTDAGRFLIEGTRETARAAEAGVLMHEVFLCPEVAPTGTFSLAESLAATGARVTTVSAIAFAKLTMRQNPDGIVAVAATWVTAIEGLDRDLVLVAEAIEKPGNLGAMLRTADATDAALLVAEATVDPFNPNVVRASQGSLFSVPLAVADTARAVEWARDHGPIFVASPDATTDYWDADLSGPVSIVIGSEHAGVSDAWRHTGTAVRIPMAGRADSLNASVSAAVLLYEAVRQRSQSIR